MLCTMSIVWLREFLIGIGTLIRVVDLDGMWHPSLHCYHEEHNPIMKGGSWNKHIETQHQLTQWFVPRDKVKLGYCLFVENNYMHLFTKIK